jgi:predicted nucleic acid-binding protein
VLAFVLLALLYSFLCSTKESECPKLFDSLSGRSDLKAGRIPLSWSQRSLRWFIDGRHIGGGPIIRLRRCYGVVITDAAAPDADYRPLCARAFDEFSGMALWNARRLDAPSRATDSTPPACDPDERSCSIPNAVSELMRSTPDPMVSAWIGGLGATTFSTNAAIAEIVLGPSQLPDGRRRSDLIERLDVPAFGPPTLPVLGLDERAWRLADEVRAPREDLRPESSPSDMMIAGIAMANGAGLAPRNVADLAGLPIRVVDPWG